MDGEKQEGRRVRWTTLEESYHLSHLRAEDRTVNKQSETRGRGDQSIRPEGIQLKLKNLRPEGHPQERFLHHQPKTSPSTLFSKLEYALPFLSPLPLIQLAGMISHYPLANLMPWPASPHYHCPDLDCTLLLEGEGGVALQRYQPRYPESSPRHWVSTVHAVHTAEELCMFFFF